MSSETALIEMSTTILLAGIGCPRSILFQEEIVPLPFFPIRRKTTLGSHILPFTPRTYHVAQNRILSYRKGFPGATAYNRLLNVLTDDVPYEGTSEDTLDEVMVLVAEVHEMLISTRSFISLSRIPYTSFKTRKSFPIRLFLTGASSTSLPSFPLIRTFPSIDVQSTLLQGGFTIFSDVGWRRKTSSTTFTSLPITITFPFSFSA